MSSFFAELVGTMVLILLGNGVVANTLLRLSKGNGGGWIVITTGWAMAVFCGVLIAAPYSGAHLNPAVTLAFALSGGFSWLSVPSYLTAQMIGAALGALLVWLFYKKHYDATNDKGAILATFCTSPAINNRFYNYLGETIATFVLIFSVFYITEGSIRAESIDKTVIVGLGSVGALPVSLIVWAIGLSLGGTTGYAINPARDLMPRMVHWLLPIRGKGSSEWSYAWIPATAPLIGAALAVAVRWLIL